MSNSSSSELSESSLKLKELKEFLKSKQFLVHSGEIPKFQQLWSSSDSAQSFQPLNDIHHDSHFFDSDTDIESNLESPNERVESNQDCVQAPLGGNLEQATATVDLDTLSIGEAHEVLAENLDIEIASKVISISDLGQNRIAINCATDLSIRGQEQQLDNFVIVYSTTSNSVLFKAKGHLEKY